jgi:hypothetical protein
VFIKKRRHRPASEQGLPCHRFKPERFPARRARVAPTACATHTLRCFVRIRSFCLRALALPLRRRDFHGLSRIHHPMICYVKSTTRPVACQEKNWQTPSLRTGNRIAVGRRIARRAVCFRFSASGSQGLLSRTKFTLGNPAVDPRDPAGKSFPGFPRIGVDKSTDWGYSIYRPQDVVVSFPLISTHFPHGYPQEVCR